MSYWTKRRWVSLAVHVAFVSVPFTLSTISALLFWHAMFQDWALAVPMVLVVEVLALAGLVLYLTGIESPFVSLRHLLPFISIVPLGREFYLQLRHNDAWVAWSLTVATTLILVAIAWQCFRTIERLFIPPVEAAKEKARAQVGALAVTLAQLNEMNGIVDGFVVERMRYHAPSLTAAKTIEPSMPSPPALPTPKPNRKRFRRSLAERKVARILGHRRRERIRQNGGSYTQEEWENLCATYNHRCIKCGLKRPLAADHVIPVLLGGSSNIDNIQPLCGPCNSIKGAKTRDYRDRPHPSCKVVQSQTMPTDLGILENSTVILDKMCPRCKVPLDAARFGAAQRWGYCSECKPMTSVIASNGHTDGEI